MSRTYYYTGLVSFANQNKDGGPTQEFFKRFNAELDCNDTVV